ncbi:MAG: hypothetical protein NZL89_00250 [Leptospiraceae bacterium]|nr:hypothetical protein [Leptospiraceae bacterium]
MRIFIEHQADVLPVVERGRIVAQIDRAQLIEALSEIRPEGYPLVLAEPESAEALLRRLDHSGQEKLPTINRAFEFNALWGRAEILQAQGKLPQIKIWQPQRVPQNHEHEQNLAAEANANEFLAKSISSIKMENPQAIAEKITPASEKPLAEKETKPDFSKIPETPVFPKTSAKRTEMAPVENGTQNNFEENHDLEDFAAKTITIRRTDARAKAEAKTTPAGQASSELPLRSAAEKIHRELERGRLAINTLAALELPLLACDGSGTELFHNKPFSELRRRFPASLVAADLLNHAKDAIAEAALKGELDIEKAVILRERIPGYRIYCKAIRDYDDPGAKAQGYIFWFEQLPLPAKLELRDEIPPEDDTMGRRFAGKTLPDILAEEESRAMAWAMREANGNQSDAALLLGIPRQTFNYRYRKLLRRQARLEQRNERNSGKKP